MSQAAATKPVPTEHAPEFSTYVSLVAEGDIINQYLTVRGVFNGPVKLD